MAAEPAAGVLLGSLQICLSPRRLARPRSQLRQRGVVVINGLSNVVRGEQNAAGDLRIRNRLFGTG